MKPRCLFGVLCCAVAFAGPALRADAKKTEFEQHDLAEAKQAAAWPPPQSSSYRQYYRFHNTTGKTLNISRYKEDGATGKFVPARAEAGGDYIFNVGSGKSFSSYSKSTVQKLFKVGLGSQSKSLKPPSSATLYYTVRLQNGKLKITEGKP